MADHSQVPYTCTSRIQPALACRY